MRAIVNRLVELAIALQQIPAPTFAEGERAAFVHERFLAEGLDAVSTDELGNVFACLRGRDAGVSPLVISAHTDSVFPPGSDLRVTRRDERVIGAGIGDNATGVAGMFALLWVLREQGETLPGDVWFVANVGEEGLGDLRGMKAVVQRFGDAPRAYIVLEGLALGQVYNRALGVRRYRITVRTPGGHSWVHFGRPSAIHELVAVVHELLKLPLPKEPRTTLNIGTISGGVSVNTIAPQAKLALDLRSEEKETLLMWAARVESVAAARRRRGVEVLVEAIGSRPTGELAESHHLVQLGLNVLRQQGITPRLNIGSTDANVPLSRGLPAICVGLTTGGGAHTTHEYIHIQPLEKGIAQLVALVKGVFRENYSGQAE